jgi:starvation-inducible DNA-binding protein
VTERWDQGATADELQGELRDLLSLAVVGDHVRWVLTGDEAAELSDWLVDAVLQWRAWADQVAKHLVGLGVAPDGRVRSLAKDIPLNWVPDGWLPADEGRRLVADRLRTVASWARQRRSQAGDPVVAQLLDAVYEGLEAQVRTREHVDAADRPGRQSAETNVTGRAERPPRNPRLP